MTPCLDHVYFLCTTSHGFTRTLSIHSLHEFAREHYSEQNSSALVTVWRVVIEKCVTLVWSKQFTSGHCVACCYWKGCILCPPQPPGLLGPCLFCVYHSLRVYLDPVYSPCTTAHGYTWTLSILRVPQPTGLLGPCLFSVYHSPRVYLDPVYFMCTTAHGFTWTLSILCVPQPTGLLAPCIVSVYHSPRVHLDPVNSLCIYMYHIPRVYFEPCLFSVYHSPRVYLDPVYSLCTTAHGFTWTLSILYVPQPTRLLGTCLFYVYHIPRVHLDPVNSLCIYMYHSPRVYLDPVYFLCTTCLLCHWLFFRY